MLFFVREGFPAHRVDVDVLFGRELLERGHQIDFIMQAEAAAALWIAKQSDPVRTRMFERAQTWVIQNRDYARIADAVEQKYAELLH
jgi:hypothetical protein